MSFTDNFTGTSGDTLESRTGWTRVDGAAGAAQINASNQLKGTTSTNTAYTCTSQGSADHDTSYLVSRFDGGGFVCVRLTNSNNFIGARCGGATSLELYKRNAGTFTLLGSHNGGYATTDTIDVVASGNSLSITVNAGGKTGVGPVTDSFNNTVQTQGIVVRIIQDPILDTFVATAAGGGGPTYTLTAAQGSYALTGEAAALKASRKMAAVYGSYALTGEAIALQVARKLGVSFGSYVLTGENVAFKAGRKLTAAEGAYTLTGEAVTLTYTPTGGPTYTLTAAQGGYTLTGEAVAFKASRKLIATFGSYALTGESAGLSIGRKMTAAQGSLVLTGENIAFKISRALAAGYGVYVLTGKAAALTYTPLLTAIVLTSDRILAVLGEDRVFAIENEDRTCVITSEDITLN